VLDDPNATFFGQWKRIDNEDIILTLYADGANRQIALWDATPFPIGTPPVAVITSGPGRRQDPALWFDPATSRYSLVTLRAPVEGGPNVAEVWQRIAGVWTYLYEFDAGDAGETMSGFDYLQSPEPFVYQNLSYFAFLTSNAADFLDPNGKGNIRITRVDARGPPSYFKRLNESLELRKRIEAEIHYPTNDSPVAFYTQKAEGDDGALQGCNPGDNMLRRARTGVAD
jgi:hypothetical protein